MKSYVSSFIYIILIALMPIKVYAADEIVTTNTALLDTAFNGNFIWVGNTNTNPKKFADVVADENKDKAMELVNIVNKPDNGSYRNINYAEFCIPNIDHTCGPANIEFARLNWVMGDAQSDYDKVTILITDESGNVISGTKKTITAIKKTTERKITSCHADLKKYFGDLYDNDVLENNKRYRIYVADIKGNTAGADEGYNNGTGWSVFIAYSHPLEERHTITFYDIDVLGETGQSGLQGKSVTCNLKLMENTKIVDESIKMGISSFGSMFHIDNERIYNVKENGQKKEIPLGFIDIYGDYEKENAFRSAILYKYSNDCGDIVKDGSEYSRAFDLQVWAVKNDKYVESGDEYFRLKVDGANENHFLTNAVLSFGTPDIPEAALPLEVDKKDIGPDESYKCKLYVTVGDNKDGLKNIKVNIPFSEYIQNVDSLEIKFLNTNLQWPSGYDVVKIRTTKERDANNNVYLNDANGNIYLNDVKNSNVYYTNALYGTGNQIGIISQINRYLTDIDDNEKKEFLQNPAHREARMITIDFDRLVIPSKIQNTDVIEISIKLHTKPATDEVYRKTSYVGKPTSVVPQAELTTTTEKSNETSIFENTNREQTETNSPQGIDDYFKNLKCSGGTGNGNGWGNGGGNGGAGGCSGIGGDHNTSEGILQPRKGTDKYDKPIKNVIINITAESECPEVPDMVEVPFCNTTTIRPADIYQVLLHYYGLDIDSIARVDSCIWEQHKRDELIDFAERHGVNRSRMMNLLGDIKQLPSITSTAENYGKLEGFLNCESTLSTDSIDSIINMKIDYSKLLMLFTDEDATNVYQTANYIDIGKGGEDIFNTNYNISETLETYAYFQSPWKNGDCNKAIKIKFIKMDTDAPTATYKGEEIKDGGVIYACREETMKPIIIEKGHNNYDIYANIIDTIGANHPDLLLNKEKRKDNPLRWELSKDTIVSSVNPGEFKITLQKKDFLLNCVGDPLTFTLKIIDIQIKDKPKIQTLNGQKKFCQALDKKEKIKLFVEKPAHLSDLDVRWFYNYKDEDDNETQDTVDVGEFIEIDANVVGTVQYSAEYFRDQCPSQQDTISIEILQMADTLKTDTMVICRNYKLTKSDIIEQIREWNGSRYNENNLLFYQYDNTYASTDSANIAHAISQDSLGIERLINSLDFTSDCVGDYRIENFVVQAMNDMPYNMKSPYTGNDTTYQGCPGAGSIVPIKILCYKDDQPIFAGGVDSILYCTGDVALTELNSYLEEPAEFDVTAHKWAWARVGSSETLPKNGYKSTEYKTRTSGKNPETSTDGANVALFAVVRIDSNSCVSKSDTFRIVVADAIKSYAKVGDTTSVISTSRTDKLPLNFCKGENPYKDKTIPTVGYPSRDYIMEWFRKDKLDDDCDDIAENHYDRLSNTVDVDFDHVDTTYYCLRQTTDMGCKGPWLTVIVTVNDSVRETPAADTVTMCEGATPQKFVVKTTQNKDLSLYTFLSKDSSAVASTNMVVDTTEGKYISTLKHNLYYGYYKNSKTGCMSETVGFNAIVNHKPLLPAMNEDTTLYLCANGETINLAEKIESKINTQDQHTKVVWTPKDEIVTSQNTSAAYYIHQVDTVTLCEGEKIEITVKVENTFKYKEFGQKDVCFGESVSLRDTVNRLLSSKNQIIDKEALGFKVFALHNKVKGVEIKAPVQSSKSRYLNDTTFYLIEILDTISGCSQTDTATVIFHGLPNETVDATLSMCQNVALELPTPTNVDYTYVWRNGQGDVINGTPAKLILEADETISLTETDKLYGCEEKIEVDVTVYPTPDHAISADTSVCQNGKELKLEGQVNPTSDGYNTASNLSLQWFNEKKDSINNPIQTDTIALTELITDFKYTLRQTNSKTRCFKDTVITISLRKNIQLEMPDLDAVCEPEVINFVQKVDDYIFANIASTNLVNTNGLTFEYAKIVKNKAKKITADEASALTYTDQKDKVDYIYTVTDADKVCSTSDTVTVTINERPKTPLIEGGADTLFFCKDNTPIWLHALDTNADTTKTDIFWGEEKVSKDSIDISIYPSGVYAAYSKNILTGCKSEGDTLVAYISNSIEFKPFTDTIHVCHSETVNLEEEVETRLAIGNKNNYRSSIGYKIWGLIGTTPNTLKSANAIASKATKTQTDIQRFYIEVLDTVSGCTYSDTATIVFHELPTIDPIDPIVICQFQDTMLLAPTETYKYEWYREEGSRIPAPEKLQLETSEKIKLVAIDKDWSCEDSIFIQMDVKKIPEVALAEGDTFCQHSGSHPIAVKINASEDNAATDLTLKWLNSAGEEIKTPVNTDTIEFSGLSKKINYTIRQTNKATGCYKDTVIEVTINKALQLGMDDIERICQPDSIAFKSLVNDYLYTNASDINLPNVQGIEIAYARIDNGSAKKLTESQVEQLHYIEGRDSVQYIYTVTDAEKVCTASDTVFVTINQKPTVPLIEGGADTLFFCKDNSPIWLHALDTNADTTKTDIFWGEESISKDSIDISIYPSGVYAAYSKNILTGCKSDGDTLVAYISNSIEFKPFSDTIHVCHSETVNLEEEVEKRLAEGNKNNYRSSIGYKIWGLIGTTPNTLKSADAIVSKAIKTQTDIQRFYIEVLDTVSGCFYSDTATIVFHELPTIDPIDPIVICQFQDTLLLAPTETYKYEWYREEGSRIPAPEKLQLETSEKIKLVAIDKDWSCEDSIFIQMDVRKIPEVAIAQGDTFCQHSGSHPIAVQINPSEDNAAADLTLKWLNSAGEEIKTPVNTDTIEFSGLSKKINYTIRQTNKATGCYKDTVIEVTINKALQLAMDDIERICQPDSIAFTSLVNDYLYTNASDINLPNVQGIEIAYARIDNGSAKKLTEEQVKQLHYIEGRDSVQYIYTVTDAEKVCTASDTVFVTINQKPTIPVIEGGIDTLFYCKVSSSLWLHALDTNADTTKTDIFWNENTTSSDSIDISRFSFGSYTAYSKNLETGCKSDADTIVAYISNAIDFKPFTDTIHVCHNETVNLEEEVEKRLADGNKNNFKSNIGYKIWGLIGTTPNSINSADALASKAVKTQTDIQRFYIEVLDSVSGCYLTDTATIVFHELPTIDPIDPIVICQFQDTLLLAPTETYKYEWFREEGSRIPAPEKLQLETSEKIKLVATDKEWRCVDSIFIQMDVRKIPEIALAEGDTFCQHSGSHPIAVKINPSEDNAAADLTLKWLNSDGEEINTPVNTDTIEFSGLSKKINYTIRQTNKATGCYKDTVIEVTINKALQLAMDDIERICQPDSIAFTSLVNDYLYTNASSINLPNVQGIEIAYARIDNGSAKNLTEDQVEQLHYIEGRDSVQYIYTVTDAEKVCTASDTVFVTINQKPTIPVIEGGIDTLFYCKVSSSLWLHALDTNSDTTKTDIFWGEATTSSDSIDISRFSFGTYTAYSKNMETGCKSDADTIVAYISSAIDFKPFTDTIHVCHNETVNLEEEVEKRLADGNKNNFKSNIGYKIWGLIGTTPNAISSADALASKAVKTQTDIQRFYIEVLDSVSGCYLTDTATIVFHELPTIDPIDPIVICQFQDTLLLAPTETYKYEWFREEGSRIPAPEKLQLETSEKIKLVATDKEWRCVDSIFIQMDVRKIPEVALAEGGTYCQHSGSHPIEVKINASEDNAATDLSIQWMNSDGEEIKTPVNTDTIEFSGLSKKINYTIRQTNKATGCYKDTVIEVTINKALQLAMDDIERTCQPDSVAFKDLVNDYLYTNANKINLTNVQGIEITYARIDNDKAVKLEEGQVEKLRYIEGRDSVAYIYTVTDAEKVCSVSDTVFVTINQKPVPPVIENGVDSIFFCGTLSEIKIGAKNENPVLEETRIFWGETKQAIEGDSLLITAKEKKYTAFTKNIYTECVSDLDSIVAVISDPIKVTPIGENGVIELCAGEHINVADTARSSFIIAERQNSDIVYGAKAGGNIINMTNLSDVSRAKQDTIVYEFTATDKLNGCEATNTLTLIFHDKPKFEIEGKKILCQGEELVLSAVGESRATSYTWQFEGVGLIEGSSDQFNKKELMQDTVVLVVAQLDGTSCIDSVKQAIQINETPKRLTDQTFSFCQTGKGADPNILLERSEEEREKFSLIWYDVEENEFSNDNELSLSIVNDTIYKFFVKQENNVRGLACYSELSSVTVNVNKHIIVSLRDTNICMPEKFNLAKYAKDKKSESVSGYQLNIEHIFKIDGADQLSVADSTQVEETGNYQIVYADKNNCETTTNVTLKFISKPEVPAFDETMPIYLCQGVDTAISPKFIAGDYEYIWDKIGSNETLITDTLKIDGALSNGDKVAYNVWRRDTIYGCESEKAEVSYQILDSIKTTPMETIHICESESVNLDSIADLIFTSGNELKNNIFHSDEAQKKGAQLLYSNAVTEAGFYLIEAQDNVSGCRAKSTVEIATHAAPTILYKGETSLCDGSDVRLTAYPKEGEERPEYQWTNAEGKSIQDSVLTFTTTLEEGASEAKTESLELTGTYHITNKKSCVNSETVEITTHPIPPTLPNDTIDICQNTGLNTIYVEYQDNVFNLKRYDSEGNEIENTVVNTEEVANVEFTVMQEDRITKCKGKGASIYVNVRQSIELHIDEQEEVCAPKTINLESVVNQASYASNTEIPEKKVYEIKSITKNGIEVETPNAIDQSGVYQVVIADQYGCEAGESVQLTVHQQPAPISGDTSFCQGTGIQTLAGKGESNDLILEWMDLSTAYPDSIFTDSLKVNTEKKGEKLYLIRQTTLSSHCSSEAAPMTITIHPAIAPTLTDTMICFGETFDFVSFAERHVTEGVNPILDETRRTEPIMPIDYTAIKQAGSFIAHYTDANRCEASDTMTLAFAPKIEIELDYTKEVCAGDTIQAKVSGAEHYIWNQASDDIDNISIATEATGVQEIGLTASIVIQPADGTSCSIDTTFLVQINKVPDLISGYGDTTYCQATPTEALTLQPTDENAMVLWYDPNDDYATVSKDGTLKPSSLYAGDFTYKFRQQLGECQTALQDYIVHIQSSIEEKAIVSDTAYCKDELTDPLLAKWENPLYEVIWSDENDNPLEPGYKPSSATAGEQKYFARLSYKACQGEASSMKVTIQEKYDRKPDINGSFIFCENTGNHTIQANSIDNGARLNWYAENSNERLDSIVINTDESNWKEATFYVTQSVINGCESPSTKFDVSIKDAIQPLSFHLDTCAGLTVTLDEIMAMQNIQEKADTLWNGTDKSQRMDLKSNIGYTGDYQFSVVNEFGCKATHTAHINMLKVEDLEYTSVKSIYCYDDSVSLTASSSNADFEWENVTEGLNHYGKSYDFVLSGDANVTLTATIINKPVCKESIDLVFKTYDKTKAIINGETNTCLGNTINLNTGNLYNTKWSLADSTIESDEFTYTPTKSEFLTISGIDENQCPVDTTITINTVKQPDPTIVVTPMIHSTLYQLNRDTFEVHLEASISSTLDENYSYKWDFGDGQSSYGNSVEDHEYEASLVRLTKPIDVTLTVEHAYGCAGEATTRLLVDPDFDVPNTMTPEDEFMEDYELQIFDRIGNLIYEGTGWHGQTNKGEDAFADTYFYAITYFINGEKKIKTGYITLVR